MISRQEGLHIFCRVGIDKGVELEGQSCDPLTPIGKMSIIAPWVYMGHHREIEWVPLFWQKFVVHGYCRYNLVAKNHSKIGILELGIHSKRLW